MIELILVRNSLKTDPEETLISLLSKGVPLVIMAMFCIYRGARESVNKVANNRGDPVRAQVTLISALFDGSHWNVSKAFILFAIDTVRILISYFLKKRWQKDMGAAQLDQLSDHSSGLTSMTSIVVLVLCFIVLLVALKVIDMSHLIGQYVNMQTVRGAVEVENRISIMEGNERRYDFRYGLFLSITSADFIFALLYLFTATRKYSQGVPFDGNRLLELFGGLKVVYSGTWALAEATVPLVSTVRNAGRRIVIYRPRNDNHPARHIKTIPITAGTALGSVFSLLVGYWFWKTKNWFANNLLSIAIMISTVRSCHYNTFAIAVTHLSLKTMFDALFIYYTHVTDELGGNDKEALGGLLRFPDFLSGGGSMGWMSIQDANVPGAYLGLLLRYSLLTHQQQQQQQQQPPQEQPQQEQLPAPAPQQQTQPQQESRQDDQPPNPPEAQELQETQHESKYFVVGMAAYFVSALCGMWKVHSSRTGHPLLMLIGPSIVICPVILVCLTGNWTDFIGYKDYPQEEINALW